jgi:hypothetical protein
MALGRKKVEAIENAERALNPSNSNDKRIILDFERELEPYRIKSLTLFRGTPFELMLTGFRLYLHEKGLFRYSESYKLGAVVDAEEYREALRKYEGLGRLLDQRKFAEAKNQEAFVALTE